MSGHTTRRGFLGKAAAAGGCLVMPGLSGAARPAQSAEGQQRRPIPGDADLVDDAPIIAINAPITLVTQSVCGDVHARAGSWAYVTEILQRAGLFFKQLPARRLPSLLRRSRTVVLLAGDLQLTSAQREVLASLVESGGSLIGIGGTSGLDTVFGISGEHPLAEGWIKVTAKPKFYRFASCISLLGEELRSRLVAAV